MEWCDVVDLRSLEEAGLIIATLTGDVRQVIPPNWSQDIAGTVTVELSRTPSAQSAKVDFAGFFSSYGAPYFAPDEAGTIELIHLLWTGEHWWVMIGASGGRELMPQTASYSDASGGVVE